MKTNGLVNGIDLAKMNEEAVFLNESTTLHGNVHFNNISINQLHVNGTLSGIRPADFVSIHKNETISGRKSLTRAEFSSQGVHDISVGGLLNGIDTRNFLTINGDQVRKSRKRP